MSADELGRHPQPHARDVTKRSQYCPTCLTPTLQATAPRGALSSASTTSHKRMRSKMAMSIMAAQRSLECSLQSLPPRAR
jgi:hypothetical protein